MHTSAFRIDGEEIVVVHNGDWSGDARVLWGRKEVTRYEMRGDQRIPLSPHIEWAHEVELPAALLIALGRQVAFRFVTSKITSLLEGLEASELPVPTPPAPRTSRQDPCGHKDDGNDYG